MSIIRNPQNSIGNDFGQNAYYIGTRYLIAMKVLNPWGPVGAKIPNTLEDTAFRQGCSILSSKLLWTHIKNSTFGNPFGVYYFFKDKSEIGNEPVALKV